MEKIKKCQYIVVALLLMFPLSFSFYNEKGFAKEATSAQSKGIIITADRVESSLPIPSLHSGETSNKSNQTMLRLFFSHSRIYGMTMKKELQTPAGTETATITSKDINQPVELTNMTIDVTYLHFDSVYIPKLGEIGMKNVTLIAHYQSADEALIPHLNAQMVNGPLEMKQNDPSGYDLNALEKLLNLLINDAKDGTLDKNSDKTKPTSSSETTVDHLKEKTDDATKDTGGQLGDSIGHILDPPDDEHGSDTTSHVGDVVTNNPIVPPIVHPTVNHLKETLTDTLLQINTELSQASTSLNDKLKDIQIKLEDYQKKLADAESPLNKLLAPWKEKQVIESLQTYLNETSTSLEQWESNTDRTGRDLTELKTNASNHSIDDLLPAIQQTVTTLNKLQESFDSLNSNVVNLKETATKHPKDLLNVLGHFLDDILSGLL